MLFPPKGEGRWVIRRGRRGHFAGNGFAHFFLFFAGFFPSSRGFFSGSASAGGAPK
jgi:hypothetical protein